MGRKKSERLDQMTSFANVFEPQHDELERDQFPLKGKWRSNYFRNNNPLILELGCGKGEYTTGLAEKNPHNNHLGIDIKGARIWKGAKYAIENHLANAAFVRTNADSTDTIFSDGEVNEIWLPFPDPQPKKRNEKKRLTHPRYLEIYKKILCQNGLLHIKTDNLQLFEYSLDTFKNTGFGILYCSRDVYSDGMVDVQMGIQTYYEKKFIAEGRKICYIKVRLENSHSKKG